MKLFTQKPSCRKQAKGQVRPFRLQKEKCWQHQVTKAKYATHGSNNRHWRQQPGPQHLQWFVQQKAAQACVALTEWKQQITPETPPHHPFQLTPFTSNKYLVQMWSKYRLQQLKEFDRSTMAMKEQGFFYLCINGGLAELPVKINRSAQCHNIIFVSAFYPSLENQ